MSIISEIDSDIEHILVDNEHLHHIIIKTIRADKKEVFERTGFHLVNETTRRIIRGEFDGYYEGRLYTYTFHRYLD